MFEFLQAIIFLSWLQKEKSLRRISYCKALNKLDGKNCFTFFRHQQLFFSSAFLLSLRFIVLLLTFLSRLVNHELNFFCGKTQRKWFLGKSKRLKNVELSFARKMIRKFKSLVSEAKEMS